jgi:hypothetical protein
MLPLNLCRNARTQGEDFFKANEIPPLFLSSLIFRSCLVLGFGLTLLEEVIAK